MKHPQMHPLLAAALSALMAGAPAFAQQQQQPPVTCTQPADIVPAQLYGLWQLTLWLQGEHEAQPASTGALLFERHPDYPGSVRGSLKRSGPGNDHAAVVSGDVTHGEFNLDESTDGVTMDAVWEGEATPGGCGQELRGIRRPAQGRPSDEPAMHFLLRKAPGWR